MNKQKDKLKETTEQFTHAYDHMLQRTEHILSSAATQSEAILSQALNSAREKAIELGELTHEEADRIHDFVSRDLYAAGQYLAMEQRDISDWLRLNLLLVEKELFDQFAALAQAAKLELKHLEKAGHRLDEWHTGEITSIGTLRCKKCGERVHFERTGHIPPCPKCHATAYERIKE